MDKNKMEIYVKIAERAEKMGIVADERMGFMKDLESADLAFDLRLEDLLNADDTNFSHDITGIQRHINRSQFPAKFTDHFLLRFARPVKN